MNYADLRQRQNIENDVAEFDLFHILLPNYGYFVPPASPFSILHLAAFYFFFRIIILFLGKQSKPKMLSSKYVVCFNRISIYV